MWNIKPYYAMFKSYAYDDTMQCLNLMHMWNIKPYYAMFKSMRGFYLDSSRARVHVPGPA
jgi:hypothetical protein